MTGGCDGDVVLFNRSTTKIIQTLSGHSKKVNSVNFHPSHNIFVSASSDKSLKVWNGELGSIKLGHTIKTHTSDVVTSDLHATSDYVLSASLDKSWAFHDLNTGSTLAHVTSDSGKNIFFYVLKKIGFTSARVHPDGLIVGTGGVDSTVKIWDLKSLKNVATFEGHRGKVADLAFSENGYYLATSAEDSTVKLWDLRKLKNVQTTALPENFNATSLKFDYSGSYLAVGGSDVRIFIGKSLTHVATFAKHTAQVTDLCWGKDARSLVSVSLDRSLKAWGKK
jgi:pre-mRNA-processing factor 19